MKVTISKIFSGKNIDTEVEFSTEFGRCRAFWIRGKPAIEDTYEVEIEISSLLQWGKDISHFLHQLFQIQENEQNVSLIGILDFIEDNVFSLRLGTDIILIEAEGVPFEKGMFVEVVAEKIVAYDINI